MYICRERNADIEHNGDKRKRQTLTCLIMLDVKIGSERRKACMVQGKKSPCATHEHTLTRVFPSGSTAPSITKLAHAAMATAAPACTTNQRTVRY